MKISKTTLNYAKRRNMEIIIDAEESKVMFWELEEESEWMFSCNLNEDGLSWNGNIYLPQDVKEGLPAFIYNEKQLKAVIDYVSKEFIK